MYLILYHTEGCHLCEDALEMVLAALSQHGLDAQSLALVEIANDPILLERYGISIPVLKDTVTGCELNWPFGLDDLSHVLANQIEPQ